MKKISRLPDASIICFVMMIAGFSCSKQSFTPIRTPIGLTSTIEFKANGISFTWVGADTTAMSSSIVNRSNFFIFWGSDPLKNYSDELYLTIQASSLSVGTYTCTVDTTTVLYNTPHYLVIRTGPDITIHGAATEIGDYATITITSIHDGHYADGTFSAQITAYATTVTDFVPTGNKVTIKNGTFKNMGF